MGFKWLQKQLTRALKTAGNAHRYQYLVIGLLCCIFFLNIFLIIGPSIYFMDPVFVCPFSADPSRSYDESYACDHLASCTIVNDYTIVYKMKLYCGGQYKRSLVQSSLSVGSLLGLICMNIVSDLKGRKYALLADLIIAVLSALFTYVGASIEFTPLLVIASVMSGFSGYSLIVISYIMLGDICEQRLRQRSSVYINACLSLGLSTFFVISKYCNQWYTILILFMLLPLSAATVVSYILIEESPNYYLFEMQDEELCIRSLINIAKINRSSYVDCQKIKYIVKKIKTKLLAKKNQSFGSKILKSLTKWKYLKIIICMFIVQAGGNLTFYGIQYAINDIGYSFGIMNLLIGFVEIGTTLVMGQLVVDLPRKKTLSIVYGMVPILTSFFIIDFVAASPFLGTLIILIMRVMTTTGYFMIVMIQTESFPLEIQSIGAGSIQGLSQLGSVVAPFLNAFSINNGLPKVSVMGFAMLLCLIPLIFVPESSSLMLRKEVKKTEEEIRQIKSQAPKYTFL